LHLGEQQPRRDERIRDIGGDVHLQPIQSERVPDGPADQQVKSVHRDAADEYADCDRCRFPQRPGAFGAEMDEPVTKTGGNRGHLGLGMCGDHIWFPRLPDDPWLLCE
jgi:hypothetical protein